eukprot:1149577-Pelagomonas_calceolata.AAC.4
MKSLVTLLQQHAHESAVCATCQSATTPPTSCAQHAQLCTRHLSWKVCALPTHIAALRCSLSACRRSSSLPAMLPGATHPDRFTLLLPWQAPRGGPRELGWALAVDVHFTGLLAQEQVLLAIRAHEQDSPARVDPQPAEAAQGSLEHHGCCRVCVNRGKEGWAVSQQCMHPSPNQVIPPAPACVSTTTRHLSRDSRATCFAGQHQVLAHMDTQQPSHNAWTAFCIAPSVFIPDKKQLQNIYCPDNNRMCVCVRMQAYRHQDARTN